MIVEFHSPDTDTEDLGRFAPRSRPAAELAPATPPSKFDVYESILQVPHYIVFNKRGDRLRYFRLVNGRYEEQAIVLQNPRLWIPELEIGLALWPGEFRGIPRSWLRWCDAEGELIPTDAEAAQQQAFMAQQQAADAQRQRDRAETRIRQTVQNLLALGMPADQIAQITGVAIARVEAIGQEGQKETE